MNIHVISRLSHVTEYMNKLSHVTQIEYVFIVCLDYVLRTSIDKMKENGFKLTKERSRRYSAQTITSPTTPTTPTT